MAVQWREYDVEVALRDLLVGGVPIVSEGQDAEKAYDGWVGKVPGAHDLGAEAGATTLPGRLAGDPDMPVAAVAEETGIGFKRDEVGVFIEARQVKAMLREAAQRLGFIKTTRGVRQVLQHDLHVRSVDGEGADAQKLYLLNEDGTAKTEPDGSDSRPISVLTPQGPRTAIKRREFVRGARLAFRIRILDGDKVAGAGLLSEQDLADMLELGGELGIGADRSQGEGTFDVVSVAAVGAVAA